MRNITKIGIALGSLIGLLSGAGVFTIAGAAGGMWLGNCVSGLVDDRIQPMIGQHATRHPVIEKSDKPLSYWVEIISSLALGSFCILMTLNPPT